MKLFPYIYWIFSICLLTACANDPAVIPASEDTGFRAIFIDVGQGDCILLEHAGFSVLVDAGYPEAADDIIARLDAESIDTLDLALVTHADMDHYGGMAAVLKAVPARVFGHNGMEPGKYYYSKLLKLVRDTLGITEKRTGRGDTLRYGELRLAILFPGDPFLAGTDSLNLNSVVCRAFTPDHSVLLTADAPAAAESLLVERNGDRLRSDLLKVGHHGSRGSSSLYFLSTVNPRFAVISCGADNGYGHPHAEVLSRLDSLGVTMYRTDEDGTVVFATRDDGWRVEPQ